MNVRLGHIEMFVSDPVQSLPWYRDVLGFEVVAEQSPATIWIKSGEMELLLRKSGRPAGIPPATYGDAESALVMYTDALDATAAELRARGLAFAGTDGSDRCLTFTSPDGHWFQLVDPLDH